MLADRIFARKVSPRKKIRDDDFQGTVQPRACVEGLPTKKRNSKGAEITRIRPANQFKLGLSLWQRGMLCNPEATVSLIDRKSTRLNSSHPSISYAVFCLKKKKRRK